MKLKIVLSSGVLLSLAACGGSDELPDGTPGSSGSTSAGQIQFNAQTYSASEGDGNAVISITRTGGSSGAVSVRVQSQDLTAIHAQDFTAVDTTVQFAAADAATKTVLVPLTNDTTVEGAETLQLTLSEPSGGATLGTMTSAVLTVQDNDVAPPAAARVVATVSTGAAQLTWTESPGATSYQVAFDARGQSQFVSIANALPASQRTLRVPLSAHEINWATAKFRVSACNAAGCTDSAAGFLGGVDDSVPAIGFIKASTTAALNNFGSAIALSADGNTLAVGSPFESSAATGINGNQLADCTTPTNCSQYSGAAHVFTRAADGTWSQQAYIKASRTNAFGYFGSSVALSADGNTLAVSAPNESGAATGINGTQDYSCSAPVANCKAGSGAVYVFTRSGGAWTQQAYVKASNTNSNDAFGKSVALSADGNVLVSGAPNEASTASNTNGTSFSDCGSGSAVNCDSASGAAYIFARSQGNWTQQAFIKAAYTKPAGSTGGLTLGSSIALSADGLVLAAGAPGESSATAGVGGSLTNDCNASTPLNCSYASGAVFVFAKSGASWSLQSFIKASAPSASANFGRSIALNSTGSVMATGAPYESSAATGIGGNPTSNCTTSVNCLYSSGAAYVFTRTAAVWAQEAYIKASNTGQFDYFGDALSLSADASTLAVGATGESSGARGVGGEQFDDSSYSAGAVYVFERGSSAWSQLNYVKASNGHAALGFGKALALTSDGRRLAAGANDDAPSAGVGANQLSDCDNPPSTRCANSSGAVYLY